MDTLGCPENIRSHSALLPPQNEHRTAGGFLVMALSITPRVINSHARTSFRDMPLKVVKMLIESMGKA
jgi:hypothetical protein